MKTYNPHISERATDILNLKAGDFSDTEIQGPVATVDITPFTDVIITATKTTSGSATGATTDANRKTYITGFIFAVSKDAVNDHANSSCTLTVIRDGTSYAICSIPLATGLIAQNVIIQHQFKYPLLLDKNSAISFGTVTYTAGNMLRTFTLFGYSEI